MNYLSRARESKSHWVVTKKVGNNSEFSFTLFLSLGVSDHDDDEEEEDDEGVDMNRMSFIYEGNKEQQ